MSTIISFILIDPSSNYSSLNLDNNDIPIIPELSSFSEDDYTPIINTPKQGLGNITITQFSFDEEGVFNQSENYPNLVDDLSSGALKISYLETTYLETTGIAQFNNLDDSIPESNKITVLINESISVQFNSSIENSEGYLIYNPLLYPRVLNQVLVKNNTDPIIEELNEADYTIDSDNYFVFNYQNFFSTTFHNFSLYFIFEYTLTLETWDLNQNSNDDLSLTQQIQSFSPSFYYNFTLIGTKITANLTSLPELADNLVLEIIVNPLDKDLFFDHILEIDDQIKVNFLEPDKKINVTISADSKLFSLKFSSNFTMMFENSVDFSWAIDRLIEGRNLRERIYFPSLISGPEHIVLKDIALVESTIIVDQIISNSSSFGRNVNVFDEIISITQETIENSLIFTKNAVKRKGLKLFIPYMIAGETNPCSLKYSATNDLKIVITDSIRMPLVGYRIELKYYGKNYGTYMSNDFTQPMAYAYSDENGEILIENVPNGNYTVKVYQGTVLITEFQINTFREVNYLITDVIHFPLWILIFGGISSILILLGLLLYFNNMKRS
ncbi:MAG: carboxypeptidase regulatory-like domain-containing protein [Candidatus Lokiarchaeota archaeon]|nr:carboxypeptidase regulatory-like domain-containing protein [Candidatus Lokiarchaeota archaeon]